MAKIDPTKQPGTGDEEYNFTFKEAFAAARKAGKKTFTWNGKSYHTKTKGEVQKEVGGRPEKPSNEWTYAEWLKWMNEGYKQSEEDKKKYGEIKNQLTNKERIAKEYGLPPGHMWNPHGQNPPFIPIPKQKKTGGFLEPGIESID